MDEKNYKAINFDLDTNNLKEHYPKLHYQQAYEDLRIFFNQYQFSHRQGSGYVSDFNISYGDIFSLTEELSGKFPWICNCTKAMDVTDVGQYHDLLPYLKGEKEFPLNKDIMLFNEQTRPLVSTQQSIINDIKRNGFKPTSKIIQKIEKLNHLTKRNNTMKDIATSYKTQNLAQNKEAQELVNSLGKEFKTQEMQKAMFMEIEP